MTAWTATVGEVTGRGVGAAVAARGGWRGWMVRAAAIALAAAEAMSFLDHLDELRRRLIWSLVAVAVAFGACWIFADDLYAIASAPIRSHAGVTLAVFRPQDIFALYFKVTAVAAIFLASPFILWQAWLFVSPGLHAHERRYAVPVVLATTMFFLLGGAFGYFVAFPMALGFLVEWTLAAQLTPMFDATAYFDLFFSVMLAFGLVFQIPIVTFVLSRLGIVDARFMVRHLKHAVLGSTIIAAVITPTPDAPNMLVLAVPMVALYCVGIVVAWVAGKPRQRPAM